MKRHLSVVDDDASARNGLARLLRASGYLVNTFNSANKFLETLDEHSSECILLDIRMPEMSGDELAKELKKRNINLSIIVVTADYDENIKQIAKNMGAVGFFRKPVDGKALLDMIAWALKIDGKKNSNHDID